MWFMGSIVSYSDSFKESIGVNKDLLKDNGAVSEIVAKELSLSTLKLVNSDICLSITGIAGPTGGSPEKPIGTVCFSFDEKMASAIKHNAFLKAREMILDTKLPIKAFK